jgi:hypothetical protein
LEPQAGQGVMQLVAGIRGGVILWGGEAQEDEFEVFASEEAEVFDVVVVFAVQGFVIGALLEQAEYITGVGA